MYIYIERRIKIISWQRSLFLQWFSLSHSKKWSVLVAFFSSSFSSRLSFLLYDFICIFRLLVKLDFFLLFFTFFLLFFYFFLLFFTFFYYFFIFFWTRLFQKFGFLIFFSQFFLLYYENWGLYFLGIFSLDPENYGPW